MRKYQEKMSDHIYRKKSTALFLDPGMGKTLILLKAMERIKKERKNPLPPKFLLVSTVRIIESVWRQEAEKWNIDLSFSLVRGSPKEREEKLKIEKDVYLLNFEMLVWLLSQKSWFKDKRPLVLVIDESTMLKDSSTKKFKAIKKMIPLTKKRVIMTGTPIPTAYLNLWSQFFLLDEGERLEKSFNRFRSKYFSPDYMGFNFTPLPGAEEIIQEKIGDLVLRLNSEDYVELPEIVENRILIDMDAPLFKKYKEFEKHQLLELSEFEEGDGKTLTAQTAAVLHSKLCQFTSGIVYTDKLEGEEIVKEETEIHRLKFQAAEEFKESLNGKPFLLVYKFKAELAAYKKIFKDMVILVDEKDTAGVVGKWNQGKIPVLAIHPKAGGHGLNLQEGGAHLLLTCPLYSGEDYIQIVKRLHRSGQKNKVTVNTLIINKTVDGAIENTLDQRISNQKDFLSYCEGIYNLKN